MLRFAERALVTFSICLLFWSYASASDLTRSLKVGQGDKVQITNLYGRVAVRTVPTSSDDGPGGKLVASSGKGVEESDVRTSQGGRTVILVSPRDRSKRVDLLIDLPDDQHVVFAVLLQQGLEDLQLERVLGGNAVAVGFNFSTTVRN